MTGKVNFNALRNKALTADATTTTENVAAVDGFHAGAESKLLFAGALGGLVGAFAGHSRGMKKSETPLGNPRPRQWGEQNRVKSHFVKLQVSRETISSADHKSWVSDK